MSSNAATQQYINDSADPALSVYASSNQTVPAITGNATVVITNINEYTTIKVSNPAAAAGNTSELQFNMGGSIAGDDGLTYNPTTDSLTVIGNLTAGVVLTNTLKYANGVNWNLGGSTYSNANAAAYLPTYTGDLTPNKVTASLFQGSGANLTNIPAGNIVGSITASTVTTNAQPNITSTGTLISLTVTGKVTAGQLQGDGGNIANITAGNITGTVALATHAGVADLANSVAGGNVTGTVANATNSVNATFAGTVTASAQPNITSTGTLSSVTVSGVSTLGAVGNVRITGGTSGYLLSTNGSGTLSWAAPGSSTLQDVTTNGNTSDVQLHLTNTTQSTAYNNGALVIAGGLGTGDAIHSHTHIAAETSVFAGHLADWSIFTVPKFIGRDTGAKYLQGALVNTLDTGSADWIAYGDSYPGSDDDHGWVDIGFTGTAFNDENYTITKPNDGYIFAGALSNTAQGAAAVSGMGGNLVFATDYTGANCDIVFATGGFDANNEMMRLDHQASTLYVGRTVGSGTNVVDMEVNGNVTVGSKLIVTGNLDMTGNSISNIANISGGNATFIHNNLGDVGNITINGGADGQVLTTDGAGTVSWTDNKDEAKFALHYQTFTCEVGKRYLVDTVGGVASTTLPASPTVGDAIFFVDAYGSFASNNFVIHPNGKTVMGASGDYAVSTANISFGLVYNGAGDWRVY